MYTLSIIIASAVPLLVLVAGVTRIGGRSGPTKGIGWQFIRFTIVSISMPIVGVLALNSVIPSEVATGIIWAVLGYAFGLHERTQKELTGL